MSMQSKMMLFFAVTTGLAALALVVRDPAQFWPLVILAGFSALSAVILLRQRRAS